MAIFTLSFFQHFILRVTLLSLPAEQ